MPTIFLIVARSQSQKPGKGDKNHLYRLVCIRNMTHKINTTQCTWTTGGIHRYAGNVTMHEFAGTSYNHGPHVYGVCTFQFREKLNITKSLPVDIVGRHSLSIKSSDSIYISAPLILDWSPARNRTDMWLGGFCSRDDGMNRTNGMSRGWIPDTLLW